MNNSNKNRMYEIEKKRRSLFFLGLIAAASLTLTAFEWRTSSDLPIQDPYDSSDYTIIEPDLHAIQIETAVNTATEKTVKASLTQFILSDLLKVMPKKDELKPIKKMEAGVTKLNPLKEVSIKGNEFTLKSEAPSTLSSLKAHELPFTYACATINDPDERFSCTEAALTTHLKTHIRIPDARELPDLPELFYVQFIIDEYGAVGELKYSKELPEALKAEIDKAFNSIPFLHAAQVDGRNVKVIFAIPLSLKRVN